MIESEKATFNLKHNAHFIFIKVVLYNIDVTAMCIVTKCKQPLVAQLTVFNHNAFSWSVDQGNILGDKITINFELKSELKIEGY